MRLHREFDTMTARLAYANILAEDVEALSRFYSDLFGFPEIKGHRSPIYRCLDAGGIELGFNAPLARGLLNLDEPSGHCPQTSVFLTFEAQASGDIERLVEHAVELGGRLIKQPYDTYYNARQSILADPEGNVFRVNYRKGPREPAGIVENPPWQ